MEASRTTSFVDVEVSPAAREQAPVLANLLELYSHDFSEFVDLSLGPDGRFGYPHLQAYWEEPGRHPFIIKADGRLAGFVFVRRGSAVSGDADVWDVAEFFVARGFRRRGVGMAAARAVWAKFPGRWEVRVVERNERAAAFWRRAVAGFIGREIEPAPFSKDGQSWRIFSFDSAAKG